MRVNVLFFGVLRESFAGGADTVLLGDGATVADLVTQVRGGREGGVWATLAVAVNREYAGLSTLLRDGDEVALLPPVSGGSRASQGLQARPTQAPRSGGVWA